MVLENFQLAIGQVIFRHFHDLLEKPVAMFIVKIFGGQLFGNSTQALRYSSGKRNINTGGQLIGIDLHNR